MRIRSLLKAFLYGARPFYSGTFPYFSHRVYFPRGSHLFVRACQEGIYESSTVELISSLVRPGSTYIDVGANIGLLSIPILVRQPHAQVISIEASPDTLAHLRKTRESSPHAARWSIVASAAGKVHGSVQFHASNPANGAFDGFKDTKRGGAKRTIEVNVLSLDEIWRDAGSPPVSVIKIDVEGAEADVIAGTTGLIAKERPVLVIEWSALNLPTYGVRPGHLLEICHLINYSAFTHPNLCEITNEVILELFMAKTETFVLVPKSRVSGPIRDRV